MNRKSKIIVSIVGIFIVFLALLGITYGYFLTRIQGNTNDTSISITTANLRIVYADTTPNIEAENIQPSKTEYYTKTFTVTNEGNEASNYAVYLENIINHFVHDEDLLMFITCSSNIQGNTCNGYGDGSVSDGVPTFGDSTYPTINSKLIENTINPSGDGVSKEIHTYTLYLRFLDDDSDQSDDMGKELHGKIQIYDPKDVVSISGVVNVPTGDNNNYYVELHSDVKTSQIASDGSYVIHGVEPENEAHTLYIKYKDSSGVEQTVGSQKIKVSKGNNASISITNDNNSSIVMNGTVLRANINITISNDGITLSNGYIQNLNNFEEGTLASKIISDNELKDGENLDFDTVINGLYYTGKNTENNGISYFYRGNVNNNYLVLADSQNGICKTTSGIDVKDFNIVDVSEYTECLTSNICVRDDEEGFAKAGVSSQDECNVTFLDYEDEDGNAYFHSATFYEAGTYVEFTPNIEEHSVWRIVRINEDGSVRLIYYGDGNSISNTTASSIGIRMYAGNIADYANEDQIKELLNSWYESNLSSYSSSIVDAGFCNDMSNDGDRDLDDTYYSYTYGFLNRESNRAFQFACPDSTNLFTSSNANGNKALLYPIGLLTGDEVMYSGVKIDSSNNSYLSNYENGLTMTPRAMVYDSFIIYNSSVMFGVDEQPSSNISGEVYPVINIKGDLSVEGNGTTESPYLIVLNQ